MQTDPTTNGHPGLAPASIVAGAEAKLDQIDARLERIEAQMARLGDILDAIEEAPMVRGLLRMKGVKV